MNIEPTAHLSDERLLLIVDGELDSRDTAAALGHLRHCSSCRARLDKFVASSEQFAHVYHQQRGASSARSRDALKAQLAQASSSGRAGPSWGAACGLLAAAVIGLQFLSDRSGGAGPRDGLAHNDPRPVAYLTPGATRPVGAADLCARRMVAPPTIPAHVRLAVVRDYRMERLPMQEYELDYLITPELGGSDDRRNLWPEPYASQLWNARVKDELEELLPSLVCAGTLPLAIAQHDMATDWVAAYKKYFHTDRPRHVFDAGDATPDFASGKMPTLRYDAGGR